VADGSAPDPHLGDDVVSLVLGEIDGARRSAMTAHVLTCPDCRQEYDETARAVAELLPGVPAVQPPRGFDERVLTRLDVVARPDVTAPRAPIRSRWRPLPAVAAAVVFLVGVGLAVIALTGNASSDDADSAVRTLRTSDERAVGTVSVSDVDGANVIVVAFTESPADVTYSCRVRLRDGRTVWSEPWSGGANGAWVLPLGDGGPDDVETVDLVVSGTDTVWSSAHFD